MGLSVRGTVYGFAVCTLFVGAAASFDMKIESVTEAANTAMMSGGDCMFKLVMKIAVVIMGGTYNKIRARFANKDGNTREFVLQNKGPGGIALGTTKEYTFTASCLASNPCKMQLWVGCDLDDALFVDRFWTINPNIANYPYILVHGPTSNYGKMYCNYWYGCSVCGKNVNGCHVP